MTLSITLIKTCCHSCQCVVIKPILLSVTYPGVVILIVIRMNDMAPVANMPLPILIYFYNFPFNLQPKLTI